MRKRKVTLKWPNGNGDVIYFQSITVFLLLSCHLFWMSSWTLQSFMFLFHSCRIIEQKKKIIESDILRIQSELFRINIISKAWHSALDILFRKIIPAMRWLLFSENIDTEEKNTSPPTTAVEFGWNCKGAGDGRRPGKVFPTNPPSRWRSNSPLLLPASTHPSSDFSSCFPSSVDIGRTHLLLTLTTGSAPPTLRTPWRQVHLKNPRISSIGPLKYPPNAWHLSEKIGKCLRIQFFFLPLFP